MRRAAVVAALAVLAVAAVAAEAAQPGFRYGVAAAEVTARSAILWTRAPSAGAVRLEVVGEGSPPSVQLSASPARDLTVSVRVRGLRPATRYSYRFRLGSQVSAAGRFVTAPAPGADAQIRFAITGDADATPGSDGRPLWSFDVYARMAAERNDFNINLGDTMYSDSGVGGAPVARTVPQKWEKYRQELGRPQLRALRRSAGLYSHWGDHEFVNDFSRPEHGDDLYRAGVAAFRAYSPVPYTRALGIFRNRRWGRHLELFFLDGRSFRSAKATSACGGDLAPTLPRATRDALAPFAPSLRNSVPAGCLSALGDPSRTILGRRQYAAFTRAIERSTATWKVVVTDTPMQQYYVNPYDRWEGFAAERARLLRFLARVENVVFLTTDTHANLINRVRHRTLGGPVRSTAMWEAVTGPAATATFSGTLDRFFGAGGARSISALFLKPQPPAGLGMRCAALDSQSYAEVTVTAKTLTVAPRDARGRAVREASGRPCEPLVLRAR
jgi:alkaline phosphatase D